MKVKLEPVLALMLPVLGLGVIAAGQAFLDGEPVRGIISAGLTALVASLTALVRSLVTPTADPRNDEGISLTPKV